nr:hypothetical protein BaRGS_009942 [Batillaria attramentaria]
MRVIRKLSDRSKWLDKRIDNLEIHKVTAPTGGAVYVRWGNQECAEGNDLVYAEFAPKQTSPAHGVAYVYGTEYEIKPLPQNDHDSVCAVVLDLPR